MLLPQRSAEVAAAQRSERLAGRVGILSQARLLVMPAFLGALAITVRLSLGPLPIDDSYITFRYARNIAEGLGFVYNAGEHVLGTTTPLWTLFLAVVYAIGLRDLPLNALVIAALADGVTVLSLYSLAIGLGLGRPWAAYLAGLFALSTGSIVFAASGMETSLFTAACVLALSSEVQGHPIRSAVFGAVAALIRPDGLVIAGLVALRHRLGRRLPPPRQSLVFLALVLPWLAYSFYWFGGPIPQTIVAKSTAYAGPTNAWTGIFWLLLIFVQPGFNPLTAHFPVPPAVIAGSVVLWNSAVGVVVLFRRQLLRYVSAHLAQVPLVLFPPIVIGGYAAAGVRNALHFDWYLVPLIPFALLLVVALLASASRYRKWSALLAATAFAAWHVHGFGVGHDVGMPMGLQRVREESYAAVAQWLAPRVSPDSLIALEEIGVLGYHLNARVLDTVGLVSPQTTEIQRAGGTAADVIRVHRPDYVATMDCFLGPVLADVRFADSYTLVAEFPSDIWDCKTVLVYERTELSPQRKR